MSIIKQLEDYCNCITVDEKDVDELINLISTYTCWSGKVCDTFLSAERREVVSLPNCICDCDVFEFEPFYTPFDVDSFTFTLIEQNGILETATPITDYTFSIADENFRIALPLPNCDCGCTCGCEPEYKLLVTYTAGYEELPECLLPIFCDALSWIRQKNDCCGECEPCQSDNTDVGEIDFTTLEGNIQDYFLRMLAVQYRNQLSLISLCDRRKSLWAVVV